jgi:RHS repeat-associated protein
MVILSPPCAGIPAPPLLAEYAAAAPAASPQKEYGYRSGELLVTAEVGGASPRWLVTDHLGTPRMVVERTGSLSGVRRHDYLPFGEEIGADGSWRTAGRGYAGDTVRQQFTGYERDYETELDYAQARYYANRQGRFTSVDPISMSMAHLLDPQRINLYAYARNNPVLFVDPTGEFVTIIGNGSRVFLNMLERAVGVTLELDKMGYVRVVGEVPANLSDTQRFLLSIIRDPFVGVQVEARLTDPNLLTDRYEGTDGFVGRMTANVGNIDILAEPGNVSLVAKSQGITRESIAAHIVTEGYLGAVRDAKSVEDNPSIHVNAIEWGENGVRQDHVLPPRSTTNDRYGRGRYRGVDAIEIQIDFGSHLQAIVVQADVSVTGRATATGKILDTQVRSRKK